MQHPPHVLHMQPHAALLTQWLSAGLRELPLLLLFVS